MSAVLNIILVPSPLAQFLFIGPDHYAAHACTSAHHLKLAQFPPPTHGKTMPTLVWSRPAGLSHANVGIIVEGTTDAAHGAADIVFTEPDLSDMRFAPDLLVHVQLRLRCYHHIIICFTILAFACQFDFALFMLLIALQNDGTVVTLSIGRVLPSNTPDSWNSAEIFAQAVAYSSYLNMSTIALIIVILETNFFENKFDVSLPIATRTTTTVSYI
ncbi:plasma membrane H+-ATPase [Ceratobasidium sp. 414]|nr:plasma membrane H+-ATPase [Ceratobasidium sp. 414]